MHRSRISYSSATSTSDSTINKMAVTVEILLSKPSYPWLFFLPKSCSAPPPIVIGVGLGGTSDKAAYLAKRALLRTVGEHNADPLYADMEQRILDKVNASGVGPQGLGGTVTALSCAIEPFGTHIAGLPCVVNISCHVTRHAEGEI